VITLLNEFNVLKVIGKDVERCCFNRAIYEITYNLGSKWLVCNECYDLEEFQTRIKEKVRIQT
jgi:hypothetical protein